MKDRERDEKKSPTSVVGVVETDVENNEETFYGKKGNEPGTAISKSEHGTPTPPPLPKDQLVLFQ